MEMRTIQLDSVPSSASGYLLVGGYTDPETGRLDVAANFRVTKPISLPELSERAVYDSIEIVLRPDSYSYGDTMPAQAWSLHQLARPLELEDDQSFFYSHNPYRGKPQRSPAVP